MIDDVCESSAPMPPEACITDQCSCQEPPRINHSDYTRTAGTDRLNLVVLTSLLCY